ncbi:MAG TPA: transporter, partial [Paenibacillus sp.]|nr:transporter [Paenibacillus sp.]
MRNTTSTLEVVDVETGERTPLLTFDDVIEAPNWTRDGTLIYNGGGSLFAFDLETRAAARIDTGFATSCNNDHVLSPDHRSIAISHHTAEDGRSRIYTLPLAGGHP